MRRREVPQGGVGCRAGIPVLDGNLEQRLPRGPLRYVTREDVPVARQEPGPNLRIVKFSGSASCTREASSTSPTPLGCLSTLFRRYEKSSNKLAGRFRPPGSDQMSDAPAQSILGQRWNRRFIPGSRRQRPNTP